MEIINISYWRSVYHALTLCVSTTRQDTESVEKWAKTRASKQILWTPYVSALIVKRFFKAKVKVRIKADETVNPAMGKQVLHAEVPSKDDDQSAVVDMLSAIIFLFYFFFF